MLGVSSRKAPGMREKLLAKRKGILGGGLDDLGDAPSSEDAGNEVSGAELVDASQGRSSSLLSDVVAPQKRWNTATPMPLDVDVVPHLLWRLSKHETPHSAVHTCNETSLQMERR